MYSLNNGWLKYGGFGAYMAHIFHLRRIKHEEGDKWLDYRSGKYQPNNGKSTNTLQKFSYFHFGNNSL